MTRDELPTVFLSHGAPTTPLENIPAKAFWEELGAHFRDVDAVLVVSAHWEAERPTVSFAERPETIHDFYGFPAELYAIEYPAPGAPDLGRRVAGLLAGAGIAHDIDRSRGLDHGAWVPLRAMFPQATVPVTQLSIRHGLDPAEHLALGRALAPLRREGVLVIGSGGAIHPLGAPVRLGPGVATDAWAQEFDAWLTDAVTRGDADLLVDAPATAPSFAFAHPRPDHYVPLLAALGAAGPAAGGRVLHQSWYWGNLGMAVYEFGE